MATYPYYVLSPSTILSVIGLIKGPDPTPATPREDWRTAKVDVIIPALNEAEHIALCLASLMRQTLRPRRIMLIDDGSTDGTVDVAESFCRLHGVELVAIKRRAPIGKTPTLKRQARELDSDVTFILDADTVLESEDYIARAVEELFKAAGVASVCGTILPLRQRDRRSWVERPELREFARTFPQYRLPSEHRWRDLRRGVTNLYREVLYLYLQRFIYRGQNVALGTIMNPVGCAVAYRRKYVKDLFDHFGPILGDDLTNSEDIFIGFSMMDNGYRNVHLSDVYARTVEPECHKLPRQLYLWSSAFLQSCYYFDPLVRSPLKALRRAIRRWTNPKGPDGEQKPGSRSSSRTSDQMKPKTTPDVAAPAALAASGGQGAMFATPLQGMFGPQLRARTEPSDKGAGGSGRSAGSADSRERRRASEPYRQAFGRERTVTYGRPAGWMLMMAAVEKIFFPTALIIMLLVRNWEALAVTIAAETAVGLAALMVVMKGQRLEYLVKGILVAPIRYVLIATEAFTIGRFAVDLWVRKDRRWRK